MAEDKEKAETAEKEVATDPLEFDPKDIPDIDSKYRLILLAAQRAKQIQRGADPRVDLDSRKFKPTTIALEEFEQDKVNFRFTEREKG
ncbi:MAG TPA: DNA-directed RNA polymerase subunit omega [Aridibacter sp.]|nr:DNA-directed RNA polymerase subunit omega [Aridibacter sp.]